MAWDTKTKDITYLQILGIIILISVFALALLLVVGCWYLITAGVVINPDIFAGITGFLGLITGRLWGYGDQVIGYFFGSSIDK